MVWLRLFAFAWAALLAASPVARAQGEDKARARKLVQQAQSAEKAGRFLDAVELHKEAYAVMPHPTLVFNIAQAYRRAGNKRRAFYYYRAYLDKVATGKLAQISRRFSAEIETELGAIDLEVIESELAREALNEGDGARAKSDGQPTTGRSRPPPNGARPASELRADPDPLFGQPPPPTPGDLSVRPVYWQPAFEAMLPLAGRNQLDLEIATADVDAGEAQHFGAIRARLELWKGIGGAATIPFTLVEIPDQDNALDVGNIEMGVTHRIRVLKHEIGSVIAGTLPSSSVDGDEMDNAKAIAMGRSLGDLTRFSLVVPGLTSFRAGSSMRADFGIVHYRAAAEVSLIRGYPGRVVLARFDGDVGLRLGPASITLGSVTRVGGVIGQIVDRDRSVLQTLGATAILQLDRLSFAITGGFPVVTVDGFHPYVALQARMSLDGINE